MLEDKKKQVRVALYGRVSTEHEAQVSALENQMAWYDDLLSKNPNWIKVEEYVDKGITGTQAQKRPAFMQMIKDAKDGKFDLIITREVSRFARNIVDAITFTRELKEIGVEVYFVNEAIKSMDSDGEFKLSLFGTFAQLESQKISERVKAGQKISRENGILYGNGNILGYDLHRNIDENGKWDSSENTYVINPEQAETG
jgi:DNA invertase Pin-like site-specific DNA recombinase